MKEIAVLGGGPSGLAAAWQLGLLGKGRINVYEKSQHIGGGCGYYSFGDLKLDYGPHKIYSVIPGIMDAFGDLGKDRLKEIRKKHRIVIRHHLLDYPVKLRQLLSLFSPLEVIVFGLSVLDTMIKHPFLKKPISYEDYCIKVFGRKVYEVVFKSLAEKMWGDPKTLSADLARTRIPTKSIYDIISRLLGLRIESKDIDADIMLYPYRGFYDICECMAEQIKEQGDKIHLNKKPVKLNVDGGRIKSVTFDDGNEKEVDLVISSIPLKEFISLLFAKNRINDEDFIQMRHCIIAYLFVNKPKVLEDHWVFCTDTDKEMLFSRISEQKLFSDAGFPEDKTIVSCDFTCDENNRIWNKDDKTIAEECIKGLRKIKILNEHDVIDYRIARIPHFYPIYNIDYDKKIDRLVERINKIENIICTGRLGLCNYNNIDHCLDVGIFLTKELAQGKKPPDINKELLQRAKSYRIVD